MAENRARPRIQLRRDVILGSVFLLLVVWLWLLYQEGALRGGPSGRALGADYAMFATAAQVMRDGGNPYDHHFLYLREKSQLAREHLSILKNRGVVRVGNPPLLFWAMEPLAEMPFQPAAIAWIVSLLLISAAAFLALLRYMGWRVWLAPLILFMLVPQVYMGPFYGNVVSLEFAGVSFALFVMRRHPALAGVFLTVAWLKPVTAFPVVLLIILFHTHDRRSAIGGFVGATATLLISTILLLGWHRCEQWIGGLLAYSRDLAISPDMASLSGLYVRSTYSWLRLSIEGAGIGAALLCSALVWYRLRGRGQAPPIAVAWLWALWFIAVPYAHFYDEVLLTVPVLAVLGRDGRWLTRRVSAVALYLVVLSLLLISLAPHGVGLLWLPLAGILLCLYRARRLTGDIPMTPHAAAQVPAVAARLSSSPNSP